MTDRVRCDSCKQMVLTEWPHSCYDFDAVERVRQCERAVVEAAMAWELALTEATAEDTKVLWRILDDRAIALADAVHAYRSNET